MDKAYLCEKNDVSKRVDFHFNPTAVKFSKTAQFERKPSQASKKAPPIQFKGTGPTELSLQLLLDASQKEHGSVSREIEQLLNWTAPSKGSTTTSSPSPPLVEFNWGSLKIGAAEKYIGHLESVSVNIKLFASNGTPTRAEVDLKLKDVPTDPKGTNPTSGGVTTHRVHSMRLGETLQAVAYAEYGDATLWRGVASVNHIDDPFRVRPGTRLLLPSASDLSAQVALDG